MNMCYKDVCKYCRRVINTHRCPDRFRHPFPDKLVTCSKCIQEVYRRREKVDKLLRLLW